MVTHLKMALPNIKAMVCGKTNILYTVTYQRKINLLKEGILTVQCTYLQPYLPDGLIAFIFVKAIINTCNYILLT